MDALVSGLIDGTVAQAREAGLANSEEVRAFPGRLAAFTPETAETSRQLKRFLLAQVYSAPKLAQGRDQSVAMISELFQFFLEHPQRLPQPYSEQTREAPAHRVVCDYIAGMTDSFFGRTYDQLVGHHTILPVP